MKRNEVFVARAALAASLGMAAASAQAVPIVFDFSGTVWGAWVQDAAGNSTLDESLSGQAVVGRITVETDGLRAQSASGPWGTYHNLLDDYVDPVEQVTSELFIGGVAQDVGAYSQDAGIVYGMDSFPVPNSSPDSFQVSDISTDYWYQDGSGSPPGEYSYRQLTLLWQDDNDPWGLLDLSGGFDPLAVLPALTGLLPNAYFTQETYACAEGVCTPTMTSTTTLLIDSVTISTANVPEPGTLALFAVGLLGTGVATRRRRR